jgi:hypothetical protein
VAGGAVGAENLFAALQIASPQRSHPDNGQHRCQQVIQHCLVDTYRMATRTFYATSSSQEKVLGYSHMLKLQ